jgi:alpha-beta hydrolase superfamily lysophospholipase
MATSAFGSPGCERHSIIPRSFEAYRSETLERLEQHRAFQTQDRSAELAWNAPREWRPKGQPHKGILLVHGLGDSPWTFHDIGEHLAAHGFLVRAVLLPGHGTRPEDLLDVKLCDWRRVVTEQTQALQNEVQEVYLGGFSVGANLVLDYAYAHPEIDGLLLFSPAFKSDEPFAWLTPWIGWAVPWLLKPKGRITQNAVRYMIVPTNAFAQYYLSARKARRDLDRAPYDKPVLMVAAEHDDILDSSYLFETFRARFTNPASRLIWYGSPPAKGKSDSRVLVRTDFLPDLHISQFSHMGVAFSPDNPLYGIRGSVRICSNGEDKSAIAACEQGAPVWYAGWGYREAGKIYARLTFNPYFDWQMQVMDNVLKAAATVVPSAVR